jgi:hypothetical protein
MSKINWNYKCLHINLINFIESKLISTLDSWPENCPMTGLNLYFILSNCHFPERWITIYKERKEWKKKRITILIVIVFFLRKKFTRLKSIYENLSAFYWINTFFPFLTVVQLCVILKDFFLPNNKAIIFEFLFFFKIKLIFLLNSRVV